MKNFNNFVYEVRNMTTFKELLDGSAEMYSDNVAFLVEKDGNIKEVSYREMYSDIKNLASYLRSVVAEGEKIAVIGKNSYPWSITYLAATCGVGVIVPIDKDLRADQIEGLIKDAGAKAVLYSEEQQDKFDTISCDAVLLSMSKMDDYIEEGRILRQNGDRAYEDHLINPHILSVLLYTSGTTGVAKGVMLSQYNICSDLMLVLRRVKVYESDRVLSIAPLHHTYECTCGFLAMIACGCSIAHNSSLRKLQSELKLYKPTILMAVPLILETFRNLIIKKYRQIKGGSTILSLQRKLSDLTKHKAGKKVFGIVNETFGGNLRLILSGAALLPSEVFKDFERFGVRVLIGYGLTETSPVVLMHDDFYNAPDDIGYPVSGVQARLDDVNEEGVGELVVKGPMVMLGYYNAPEESAEVLDEDGWFHTGDLARKTPHGTYQIAGRAKSMIVSPGGKKIFPEELELHLGESLFVKECMVYGTESDGQHKITAAIFPDEDEVKRTLEKQGFAKGSSDYDKEERALFNSLISSVNAKFPNYKHINRLVIRRREFEKTTTKKIKRKAEDNLRED